MQSRSPKITIKMGGKRPEIAPLTVPTNQETLEKDQNTLEAPKTDQNVLHVSSSEHNSTDNEDSQKQMVLYDHSLNGSDSVQTAIKNPDPLKIKTRPVSRKPPEVGAFTVQCANCFKWRLIPDQEKYEVIREHITDQPFLCETTREWDRDISCDDVADIEQDGTRIWAIDKPNIAKPPPGWKRLLRLRNEASSKFADVYYTSPTGTKLRSLPDVSRYLDCHPEHAHGIGLGRFSFQIPRPLRDNYVKKRPTQMEAPKTPEYLEPSPVEPIAWAGPVHNSDVQLVEPLSWAGPVENRNGMPTYLKTQELDSMNLATKKAKRYDIDCL